MKIDINKLKIVPKSISNDFQLCIYGEPDQNIKDWIQVNNLFSEQKEKYTNITIPSGVSLSEIFFGPKQFEWMDGFSPNLNKKLHIGHFSNLVIGKAFKSLGICNKTVSIYGDTLNGKVKKEDAILDLNKYQTDFNFLTDKSLLASEVKYGGDLLQDGDGEYSGTKVFKVGEEKVVGIKSNGQTSYFYQDVCLAEMLNAPTLYLTGKEQCNHFELLNVLFPNNNHIGLGLVKVSGNKISSNPESVKVLGKKMSSSLGNVILIEEFIDLVSDKFAGDIQLIYNVFAGFILKSNPEVDKGINLDIISNPKNSAGLYLSYTMARLKSAGCEFKEINKFESTELEFSLLKAKINLKPNILFEALINHAKDINTLYLNHKIIGNEENKIMFEKKLSDLIFGAKSLGLFTINKI